MTEKAIVMTIAGSDSGGGAGIEADLKTFAAFGVHGTCAITSVTAQNSTGVKASYDLPPAAVASQIEAVCTDMKVGWAKTGMLAAPEILREVAEQVKRFGLSLVIDPVMAASAGGELLRKEAFQALKDELIPLCKAITPNAAEAGALAGLPVKDREGARKAARKIAELGAEAVIVTGGHLDASDLLYEAATDSFSVISGEFVEGGTHGTGCTYSSALTACLSRGLSFEEAAGEAKRFVVEAIRHSMPVGQGEAPVNPLGGALEKKDRYEVLKDIGEALVLLKESPGFAKLIPKTGCNIGMAIPEAREYGDIAAVEGGIVSYRGRAKPAGCVEFGTSRDMAKVILSALRYDPKRRGALNLKFSEELLSACRALGLSVSPLERPGEPEALSSMDPGTETDPKKDTKTSEAVNYPHLSASGCRGRSLLLSEIKPFGGVPDLIYDRGGAGKEPVAWVLGPDATELVKTALRLAEKLD